MVAALHEVHRRRRLVELPSRHRLPLYKENCFIKCQASLVTKLVGSQDEPQNLSTGANSRACHRVEQAQHQAN